jgi:hypothetical protein
MPRFTRGDLIREPAAAGDASVLMALGLDVDQHLDIR